MTQRFGVFDVDGFPLGFYSDTDHRPEDIPQAAIPITDAQYEQLLRHQGARAFRNGQIGPASRVITPTPPVDIVAQKMASDPVFAAFVEVVGDITTTPNIEALIITKLTSP